MSWSFRRQLFIIFLLLLVFSGVVFAYVAPIIFRAPTCSDMKQNGNESGVDCGGDCVNLCTSDVKKPTVLWYRSFLISDDVYNAIAYIENQNSAAITAMPYEFRLYDTKGTYITRVDGTAMIPPSGRYAIIETGIKVGNAIVGTTTFDFGTPKVPWVRIPSNISSLRVGTSDISLNTSSSTQRLLVTVNNKSPIVPLKNLQVAAILYDKSDNAVSISKTYIHELPAGWNLPIYFTWPRPFANPVVRYEIIPMIDVFSTGAIK